MVDSVEFVQQKIDNSNYSGDDYYLLTLHRPYNVDDPKNLQRLFNTLSDFEQRVVFPVHPRTRNIIRQNSVNILEQVDLIAPQGYIEFQGLIKHSQKVITDSGGLQK